jgi:hypothetical protein
VPVAIYLWYLWLAFEACISAIPSSSPNNRHVWCCVTVPRTASNPCRPFDFLLRHFSRSCTLCLFQAHWLKYVMRSANYWRRCDRECLQCTGQKPWPRWVFSSYNPWALSSSDPSILWCHPSRPWTPHGPHRPELLRPRARSRDPYRELMVALDSLSRCSSSPPPPCNLQHSLGKKQIVLYSTTASS